VRGSRLMTGEAYADKNRRCSALRVPQISSVAFWVMLVIDHHRR